jgi:O-antigen/teichoic acid export membrane protein
MNLHVIKLAKSFFVYGIAMFTNAALSFATFSLLTHHLNEIDYGIINLYGSFTIFMVPFISMGIQFTVSVDYFRMDAVAYSRHFANAVIIPLISCLVFTLIFLAFYQPLREVIKVNLFFAIALPFSCFLIIINEIGLSLMRNKERHYLYASFTIAKNLLEIGLTILLVVVLGMAWQGRLTSALLTLIINGLAIYFIIRKWKLFDGVFRKKEIIEIAKASLPFVPERLAIFVLAYSDRFFIDYFYKTGDVGYYGAGAQIALIVNLVILTLITTFFPFIFKNLAASNFNKVRKATLLYVGISIVVTASVIICTPFIFTYFIGRNFQVGQIYAKYLSIGFFFWAVYNVFVAYLLYLKKNRLIMTISILGMLISIGLNLFNVPKFGPIGATYTSMTVYFFMAAASMLAVNKYYNLRKLFSTRRTPEAV